MQELSVIALALMLAPITSHLVKLSLPNISNITFVWVATFFQPHISCIIVKVSLHYIVSYNVLAPVPSLATYVSSIGFCSSQTS